jgi:hypothetical protein
MYSLAICGSDILWWLLWHQKTFEMMTSTLPLRAIYERNYCPSKHEWHNGVISGAVTPGFCGDHDPQSLVFCVILFGPYLVVYFLSFFLAIVLCVFLWFMTSGHLSGIFKFLMMRQHDIKLKNVWLRFMFSDLLSHMVAMNTDMYSLKEHHLLMT